MTIAPSHPPYAATALALTVKDWTKLGLKDDDAATTPTSDLLELVERITALLLVRCVAIVARPYAYADCSTTTICRTALMRQEPWEPPVDEILIHQLRQFVHSILARYNDVPYHNREHAFHVVLSCNKMIDLMLQGRTQTFGLRQDPLMHFALLFAALIHDVEHQGLPNRQLATEGSQLAVLYNDQSIAENRSLYIGFAELLKDDYKELREALFVHRPNGGDSNNNNNNFNPNTTPSTAHSNGNNTVTNTGTNYIPNNPDWADSEEYKRFRKQVINLVLNTDIASPDRTQVAKSKFKEAFGETIKLNDDPTKLSGEDTSASDSEQTITSEDEGGRGEEGLLEDVAEETVSSETLEYIPVTPVEARSPSMLTPNSSTHYPQSGEISPLPPSAQPLSSAGTRTTAVGTQYGVSPVRRYRRASRRPNSLLNRPPAPDLDAIPTNNAAGNRRSSVTSRRSSTASNPRFFRRRLGIRMSMDLSGEALEIYRRGSIGSGSGHFSIEEEESDELKATVVLELILTAADVAHNLQGWSQMVKWSGRLYMELQRAFLMNRGANPQNRWYENQIGFLEMYLMPLAKRLEDTGVFGKVTGKIFAHAVMGNKEKWIRQGRKVTEDIIAAGEMLKTRPIELPTIRMDLAFDTPVKSDLGGSGKDETPEQRTTVDPVAVTEQPVIQSDVSVDSTRGVDGNRKNRTTFLSAMVNIIVVLVAFGIGALAMDKNLQSSLPIRRGQLVPPGTWMSRCGLFDVFLGCQNAYLSVDDTGLVTLFDSARRVLWEIKGETCPQGVSPSDCTDGLKFTDEWRIQIGNKPITYIDVYLDSDVMPWPFAYSPVVKMRDMSKLLHKNSAQPSEAIRNLMLEL